MGAVLTISLFCCHLCRGALHWQGESSQQRFQLAQVWVFCRQTPGRGKQNQCFCIYYRNNSRFAISLSQIDLSKDIVAITSLLQDVRVLL